MDKGKQKQALIDMMHDDEELGLYEQETLEQVAERILSKNEVDDGDMVLSCTFPNTIKSMVEMAKWQQEQIGKSEFLQRLRRTLSDAEARRLIFETFKNK